MIISSKNNSVQSVGKEGKAYCKFYVLTYDGRRCALVSVEEWKKIEEDFPKRFCLRNGVGCPILERLRKIRSKYGLKT